MSGIAGVLHLDGSPAALEALTGMLNISQHRGPDGSGEWIHGPVALGHQMLHTTVESIRERQPLLDESGQICITADGRVDNRQELRQAIQAAGAALRDDTDVEIILKAYLLWGEACPQKIIGDFAFAIWDQRKHKLFCARDFMGIKPFYYFCAAQKFLFGSELRQLLDFPGGQNKLNEGMIAEFLAGQITSQEETIYEGIMRLPPAHYMVVEGGQIRQQRYWELTPCPDLLYKTDQEYAEHFFAIFTEAVRCRMRSHHPVAAELSGGLDSSSIVCVAQWLLSTVPVPDTTLETFSLVFPYLPCNENEFIKEVTRAWNCKSNQMEAADNTFDCIEEQLRQYKDFPDDPSTIMTRPLHQLARQKGCRVLLTGKGGDQWLTNRYGYADLISRSRFREASDEFMKSGGNIQDLLVYGLLPFVPTQIKRAIRRVLPARKTFSWLQDSFVKKTALTQRLRRNAKLIDAIPYNKQDIFSTTIAGIEAFTNELEERNCARLGIEARHPFYDRRLVEFLWQVPVDQIKRHQFQKYILRNSLKGLLPARISKRRTKVAFNHIFINAILSDRVRRCLLSSDSAVDNMVKQGQIEAWYREIESYNSTDTPEVNIYLLWYTYCIKRLLQNDFIG